MTDKHVVEGVAKAKVIAGAKFGSFGVMEVRLTDVDGNYLRTKNIAVDCLKEMDIVKRWNSFGKAEKWLNTEEGLAWVSTAKHYN